MTRKTYAALIAERGALEQELRAIARQRDQGAKAAATAKARAIRAGQDPDQIHTRWEREDRDLWAQRDRVTTAKQRVENDIHTAPR